MKLFDTLGQGEFGEVHKGKLRLGVWTTVTVAVKMMVNETGEIDAHERYMIQQCFSQQFTGSNFYARRI